MAAALAGVLDQVEILVGPIFLTRTNMARHPGGLHQSTTTMRDSVKTKRTERLSHLAPQNEMTEQKPSIYGRFPTPEKAKPWKLGLA